MLFKRRDKDHITCRLHCVKYPLTSRAALYLKREEKERLKRTTQLGGRQTSVRSKVKDGPLSK